jgi:EPS-associated MarR family transcriptional regulator
MLLSKKHDLETEEVLKVLREIAATPDMTQRELSSRLGISLGKINFLVNALIQKGLVKAHNFKSSNNKKAYLYILTPHGLEEKTKATVQFLKRKMGEYKRLEAEIKELKKEAGIVDAIVQTKDNDPF